MKSRFYIVIAWVWCSLFLFSGKGPVFGQSKGNPFEIKPRLKEMNITDTFTPVKTPPLQQTDSLSKDNTTSLNKDNVKNDNEENPFDVDHVPLRKTSLAEKRHNAQFTSVDKEDSNAFLFWFLLLSSAIFAVVLNTNGKSLQLVMKSIFNDNILKLFQREESTKVSPYFFLLFIVFSINLSAFMYLLYTRYQGRQDIRVFLFILLGVIVVYGIKHLSLQMVGRLFAISKNTDSYRFTIMIFNFFIGIVLIPLNFLMAYGPDLVHNIILFLVLIFLGGMLLMRLFRGIFIVSEYLTDRLFQIFIYLCAFEVAPVMILIKTVMNLTN